MFFRFKLAVFDSMRLQFKRRTQSANQDHIYLQLVTKKHAVTRYLTILRVVSFEETWKCKSSWISMNKLQNFSPRIVETHCLLEFVGVLYCLDHFFAATQNSFQTCFNISWCGQSLGKITEWKTNQCIAVGWCLANTWHNHAKSLHCLTTAVETSAHFFQVKILFNSWTPLGVSGSKDKIYGLNFPTSVQYSFCTRNLGLALTQIILKYGSLIGKSSTEETRWVTD